MTFKGKIVEEPFGPGAFVLEADDGSRYALQGGDDGLLRAGQRVSVEGQVDGGGAVGIGMTGDPVLRVDSYTVLS